MSLKKERDKQYIRLKLGERKTIGQNDGKNQQSVEPVKKEKMSGKKQVGTGKIFRKVKNVVCFTGLWLMPLLYLTGLDWKAYWYVYVGILATVSFGNLNLYVIGKRGYDLWDAFTILDLTNSTWRFQEQLKKNPPLVPELCLHGGGIYFGRKDGVDIGKNMNVDGHVIVFGGSGSGKSSCIAIPTLNRYECGVFAVDVKDGGELERKSQWEGKSYVFRPGDPESLGYDPYWFLDKKKPENGLKEIAYALIPANVKNPSDFWTLNEQRFLLSALYYCYDMGMSFAESCRTIYGLSTEDLLTRIKESGCRFAKEGMSDYYGMAAETLGGIVAGVGNAISTFVTDEDILEVLTKSERMTPDLLLRGERIFVCIPEHKLDVYREVLQLIISQFLRYFEQLKDEETRPVLMMLDEFARLGKYEKLTNGLATLRSKKVTIMILTQSVSQLDMIYGKDARKVMTDNCAYKVVLNASDVDSQQYFSKLCGNYVKYQKSYTKGKSSSYSVSEFEMPIVRPEELATLKKELLVSPWGVQWVEKRPYYRERK